MKKMYPQTCHRVKAGFTTVLMNLTSKEKAASGCCPSVKKTANKKLNLLHCGIRETNTATVTVVLLLSSTCYFNTEWEYTYVVCNTKYTCILHTLFLPTGMSLFHQIGAHFQ